MKKSLILSLMVFGSVGFAKDMTLRCDLAEKGTNSFSGEIRVQIQEDNVAFADAFLSMQPEGSAASSQLLIEQEMRAEIEKVVTGEDFTNLQNLRVLQAQSVIQDSDAQLTVVIGQDRYNGQLTQNGIMYLSNCTEIKKTSK
ncbi:MAG: hypothetical protein ACK5Y2_06685 [Bdellovibrionales bacterium]